MTKPRETRKQTQRQALKHRASRAVQSLYHNATPAYPLNKSDYEQSLFDLWFQDACSNEIEYIQGGGAYQDVAGTRNFIRSGYHSSRAGIYAARKYMKEANLERATPAAAWELISEFGRLYQYGRGGRTLAPEGLMNFYGLIPSHFDKSSAADITRAILILESFSAHVTAWCKGIPEMWEEEKAETGLDLQIAAEPVRRRIVDSFEVSIA